MTYAGGLADPEQSSRLGIVLLGVDSRRMLEMQRGLGADLHRSHSITTFFDHPTRDELAASLVDEPA